MLQDLCRALFRSTVGDHGVENRQPPLSTKGEVVEMRSNLDLFGATAPPDQRNGRYSKWRRCCPWYREITCPWRRRLIMSASIMVVTHRVVPLVQIHSSSIKMQVHNSSNYIHSVSNTKPQTPRIHFSFDSKFVLLEVWQCHRYNSQICCRTGLNL